MAVILKKKVSLSQVLKFKTDADNAVDFSKLGYIKEICPEPCKGCSQWQGSVCIDTNGNTCRHIVDWLNNDFLNKQV